MRADTLYVRDECGEFVPAKPEVVLARAKEHLKRLDKLCLFSCEQYRDLKKAVEAYEKSNGKVKPTAASN